jgi:hypothetical protein
MFERIFMVQQTRNNNVYFCLDWLTLQTKAVQSLKIPKTIQEKYRRNNQLDATKCWFIFSTCFEHYYAHLQEYISEYRFVVSKPGKYE